MRRRKHRVSQGFALPAVLATLIVLALIAVALVRLLSATTQGHDTSRKASQIDRELDSAMVTALHILHDNKHVLRDVLVSGGPITLGSEAAPVRVSMARDAPRVDINGADARLLRPVLTAAVGPETAAIALKRVTEARAARQMSFDATELLPRNLAFSHEGARLMDLFTVHSGQTGVDPYVLPDKALRAIPGIEIEITEALRAIRRDGANIAVNRSNSEPFFSSRIDVVTLVASRATGRSRALTARVVQGTGQFEVLSVRGVPAPSK